MGIKRLTVEHWQNLDPWEFCGQDGYCTRNCHEPGGCANGCIVPKLYASLAAYEEADVSGRLIILPCKVGDTVYRLIKTKDGSAHIAPATVNGIHLGDTERNYRYKNKNEYIVLRVDGNYCAHIDVKEFGKTVFLTREEAEKKRNEYAEEQRNL